ncbi:CaiB/BaiF CoA transferase family protein [Gordonia terrae]|uniref:CaiB/BaiF CoA transferase family protein n=1 Tax=Gordonia terrae TaxID=2055 RepID=UPI003F6C8D93
MSPQSPPSTPLAGVRVLDLSRVVSGPFGSLMLSDLGAEVIRIEQPPAADTAPAAEPAPLTEDEAFAWGLSRDKHSVSLDLKNDKGREIFLGLVEHADVVYDNFRPGVMRRLGLGYDDLAQRNPSIISCSLSGFGADGPWSTMPAYDPIVQAMSGTMNYTRLGIDTPPVRWGIPIGDLFAGIYSAIGIAAAIIHRDRTGVGQHVDVSMLDVMLALNSYRVPQALTFGQEPDPAPFEGGQGTVPFGNFECSDGWVALCISQRMWPTACRIMGRPELIDDPRFATQLARHTHRDAVVAVLQEVFRTRTALEWETEMMSAGVVVARVLGVAEVFDHPQVRARDMAVQITDNLSRSATVAGDPLKFSDSASWRPPRPVGADTRTVLTSLLGFDDAALELLHDERAVHLGTGHGEPPIPLMRRVAPASAGTGAGPDSRERPLWGTTVLELNGDEPSKGFAAQLLADLGARVIRVDRPNGQALEPYPDLERGSAFRCGLNRGKQSVTADLKTDEGRAYFTDLVQHADVVLDNYRPGVLTRLGIDHAVLSGIKPDIITCSITGFGHSGPWSPYPAFDNAIQALGGGMSITVDHTRPHIPIRWGNPIGGLTGALYAVLGVLGAERTRRVSGAGRRIDLALLDAQIALLSYRVPQAVTVGKRFSPEPRRGGSGSLPFGAFRTADARWFVICITPQFWGRFCEAAGHPEWEDDPRFATEPLRRTNEAELYSLVEPSFATRTADEWQELYYELKLPGATVLDLNGAFTHPQAIARGMRMCLPDSVFEDGVEVAGSALRFSWCEPVPAASAPVPGADAALVDAEFGLSSTPDTRRDHAVAELAAVTETQGR